MIVIVVAVVALVVNVVDDCPPFHVEFHPRHGWRNACLICLVVVTER